MTNLAQTVRLRARYVRDLSFENPGTPASFSVTDPEIEVSVRVEGHERGECHESALTLTARARRDATVLWIAEITYVGEFELSGIEDPARRRLLLVDAPMLLFPWVNRILADAARDGGLPMLNLPCPDFGALYRQAAEGPDVT